MTIKTTRYISSDKVRALCIKQDYCTDCDCEQYGILLNGCQGVATDSDILRVAQMIMRYSDVERLTREYGCDELELLESICFDIINDCTYTTIELI